MKQLHIISTISVLGALIIGSTTGLGEGYPMILSEAPLHSIIRAVLLVALMTIVVVQRPRTITLRAFCALMASLVLGYALSEASLSQLGIIDAAAYFLCTTILLIEALEPTSEARRPQRVALHRTVQQ